MEFIYSFNLVTFVSISLASGVEPEQNWASHIRHKINNLTHIFKKKFQ